MVSSKQTLSLNVFALNGIQTLFNASETLVLQSTQAVGICSKIKQAYDSEDSEDSVSWYRTKKHWHSEEQRKLRIREDGEETLENYEYDKMDETENYEDKVLQEKERRIRPKYIQIKSRLGGLREGLISQEDDYFEINKQKCLQKMKFLNKKEEMHLGERLFDLKLGKLGLPQWERRNYTADNKVFPSLLKDRQNNRVFRDVYGVIEEENRKSQTEEILKRIRFGNMDLFKEDDMAIFDRLLASGVTFSEKFFREINLNRRKYSQRQSLLQETCFRGTVSHYQIEALLKQYKIQKVSVDESYGAAETPFMHVVSGQLPVDKKIQLVKTFLSQKQSVTKRDPSGKTALYLAVENKDQGTGRYESLQLQNLYREHNHECQSKTKSAELVKILLEQEDQEVDQKSKSGHTPLVECIFQGDVECARVLLEHKASLDDRQSVDEQIFDYHRYLMNEDIVKEYFQESEADRQFYSCQVNNSFKLFLKDQKEFRLELENPYSRERIGSLQRRKGLCTPLEIAYLVPRLMVFVPGLLNRLNVGVSEQYEWPSQNYQEMIELIRVEQKKRQN